ncbi:MAG: hypothetical protein KBE23_08565 [Chloroflexi bacterium]|nr:hypothetical protein [Chloroflexota bacterium]MBP7042785.1 hypothetical protein [Chloroflexota bacterium]
MSLVAWQPGGCVGSNWQHEREFGGETAVAQRPNIFPTDIKLRPNRLTLQRAASG